MGEHAKTALDERARRPPQGDRRPRPGRARGPERAPSARTSCQRAQAGGGYPADRRRAGVRPPERAGGCQPGTAFRARCAGTFCGGARRDEAGGARGNAAAAAPEPPRRCGDRLALRDRDRPCRILGRACREAFGGGERHGLGRRQLNASRSTRRQGDRRCRSLAPRRRGRCGAHRDRRAGGSARRGDAGRPRGGARRRNRDRRRLDEAGARSGLRRPPARAGAPARRRGERRAGPSLSRSLRRCDLVPDPAPGERRCTRRARRALRREPRCACRPPRPGDTRPAARPDEPPAARAREPAHAGRRRLG